jgi:hypothetical protein
VIILELLPKPEVDFGCLINSGVGFELRFLLSMALPINRIEIGRATTADANIIVLFIDINL